MDDIKTKQKPVIEPDVAAEIKQNTTSKGNGFRSINDETYLYFGVRHAFDEQTGEVVEQYYPCTQDGQLTGYKVREVPKNFRSIGRTGADCELFGQFRFNRGGKYVVLGEGELEVLSGYQMLKDYNKSRGNDFEVAFVSPTTGANSVKQIAAQYNFFNSFDNIILAFDNDKAGKDAAEKIIPVLPKGKVRLMQMKYKDHNEYLEKGDNKAYISDFYSSKSYVPAGVIGSNSLYDKIVEQADIAKVSFPPFLKKLESMLGGGLILGHAYNIAAMTSIGKTATVNEMIYWWIFNSPHMVGVVSMELNSGQYGEALLSRHLQLKLARLSMEDKKKVLDKEDTKKKAKELFEKEDGSPRFFLVDDRDGTVEQIQETIEQMVISSGVKIVVLDVLQDIIEGLSNEEQGLFMKWVKSMIKSHNISIVLINHMRKKNNGDNSTQVSESDVHGASQITKSASANILLSRNKAAEDPIERNTTYVTLAKSRITGETGPAGEIYYDTQTHVMHDKEEWMQNNGGF